MPQETAQPFNKTPRSPDDPELVAKVLGTQEADDMRALTGEQPAEEEPTTSGLDDVEMATSAAERAAVTKVEVGVTKEERRQQFIAWAEEFGKGEEFIDKYFEFDDDGTVVVLDVQHISTQNISWLPEGIKRVKGPLEFLGSKLKDCENMPDIIEGGLVLSGSPIGDLGGLAGKTIKGNLVLHDILATEIPDDINLEGTVYIAANQQEELAADALAKGYKVGRPGSNKSGEYETYTTRDSDGNYIMGIKRRIP